MNKTLMLVGVFVALVGTAFAQIKPPIEEYPYSGQADLLNKAVWLQEDLHKNNRQFGIVMPRVLLGVRQNSHFLENY